MDSTCCESARKTDVPPFAGPLFLASPLLFARSCTFTNPVQLWGHDQRDGTKAQQTVLAVSLVVPCVGRLFSGNLARDATAPWCHLHLTPRWCGAQLDEAEAGQHPDGLVFDFKTNSPSPRAGLAGSSLEGAAAADRPSPARAMQAIAAGPAAIGGRSQDRAAGRS